MIIIGVDLGGRKAAVAVYADGQLVKVDAHATEPVFSRPNQLASVALWVAQQTMNADQIFIEEPIIGRGVRASIQVIQMGGAVLSELIGRSVHMIPVGNWKKTILGKGDASKEHVKAWLESAHPEYAILCQGDQDRIDAICIGLYGVHLERLSRGIMEDLH